MKFVVALDSFKGSVDSRTAGEAVRRGILAVHPAAHVTVFEMAGGGERTLSAVLSARSGEEVSVETVDALHCPLTASYGVLVAEDRHVAVVQAAARSGWTGLRPSTRAPGPGPAPTG